MAGGSKGLVIPAGMESEKFNSHNHIVTKVLTDKIQYCIAGNFEGVKLW